MLIAMLFSVGVMAQREITGTVTDESSGETLIGASVLIKGTDAGTTTDVEGKFTLTASTGDVLLFSYTGFTSQEVTVGASNIIDVRMSEGLTLQQVVVTGYATDTRRSTPGSVSTIDAADLNVVPSGNVEQQLQGRVAGVTVITNGQPGTTSQIRVRGYGALGGNEPLYVVDGVPTGSTDFLSPGDIETTTVLKDATAASIYGARAAGGVIVYTTKQGSKKGKRPLKVTYNGTIGVTTPGQGAGVLNPQEQAAWTRAAIRNAGIQTDEDLDSILYSHPQYGDGQGESYNPQLPEYLLVGGMEGVTGGVNLSTEEALYNVDPALGPIYQVVKANQDGTDWYDAITRNAALHRHNLGFSGGGESSRYYVGLGMQEQDGILLHQKFSRYTMRVNTEFDLLPNLRIGENIQVTYRSARNLLGNAGGAGSSDDENEFLAASRMSPIIPVYDEFGGYAGTRASGFNNAANPVASLDGRRNNRAFQTAIFGNVYLEFEPMENLVLRSSFGGSHRAVNTRGYSRITYENKENNSSFGYNQYSNFLTNWIWTNTASYNINFGESKLKLLVGQEALSNGNGYDIGGSGINPFSQNPDFVSLSTVENRNVFGAPFTPVKFASYFGSVKYDLQDKYIFSVVVRRDGSSRFGSENRYGVFPAFSAAWRISSESFMADQNLFDDLKIRGGYGIMGNSNNVDPNNQYSLYGTSLGNSSYDIGGTNTSATAGFYRTRIGNPFAKWEKAVTSNIGIDALMMNGRLDVGIEFWRKDTKDLLFVPPVTVMSGYQANAPSRNVGEMRNQGIDIQVINKGQINSDFSYEVILNGGFLNNEIVSLVEGIETLPNRSADYRGISPVLNQIGQPLSAFYGFQVENLWQSKEEVEAADASARAAAAAEDPSLTQAELDAIFFQEGAGPGRFRFADIDSYDENGDLTGKPDGIIDLADRTVLGSPVPDFTGGLTIKLNYKNFGFEMYSFASIGNETYNVSKLFTDFYPLFPGAAISDRVKDSWTFDNPSGDIPIFENVANFSTIQQSNSYYVEDGSYFRLQNVTLSYTLPSDMIERLNIGKLKVFGGVNNLLTITGYDGLDPSVGGAADTNFGVDLGNVPITRSWTLGVDVEF